MADIEPLLPLDRTFDALYGLEVIESNDELVRAQVKVRDEIKQPMGLVHGGIYASIAESITSTATAMAVWPEGKAAQGMSNQTSFLRPILEGTRVGAGAREQLVELLPEALSLKPLCQPKTGIHAVAVRTR